MKPMTVYSLLLMAAITSSQANAKSVDLVLRLKERVSMEDLANNVMNPSSDRYGKFYTPEEIRALAAPTDMEYQQLLSTLQSKGMKVVKESKSHLVVTVRTDAAQVESTFKTKINVVGEKMAGTSQKLSVPNDLDLVDSITGLNQTHKLRSHIRVPAPSADGKVATAKVLAPTDIKKAYGFNPIYTKGITGKGQHIAVATYGGFYMDDVRTYFTKAGISPAPTYDQVKFNGTPAIDEDAAVETELDAEFSGMIANGATIHVFASAENSDAGELAMFTAILDDNRSKVVNYSWGSCEQQTETAHKNDMDKVYARAIAQGVNIMVASGDSGVDGCRSGHGAVDADWPGSSPNIVAVGGTTAKISTAGKLTETGWSDSGGGISKFYNLPNYQITFQSPYAMRSFPDVAFNADQASGQQVWTSCKPNMLTGACSHGSTGNWMTIGGTSMAAPQWSGFMALVGEARAKANKPALGFLNPIIYSMTEANKAKVLHDITSGNNGLKAGKGWDGVTGLGSMQADALLDYLTNL